MENNIFFNIENNIFLNTENNIFLNKENNIFLNICKYGKYIPLFKYIDELLLLRCDVVCLKCEESKIYGAIKYDNMYLCIKCANETVKYNNVTNYYNDNKNQTKFEFGRIIMF